MRDRSLYEISIGGIIKAGSWVVSGLMRVLYRFVFWVVGRFGVNVLPKYDKYGNCYMINVEYELVKFKLAAGNTEAKIPKGVASIGYYAFSGCSGLTAIVIPEGVTSIGYYAFSGCSGLTAIVIPESVTSIGSYAFTGCSGLTSIVIPEGVTSIGSYAFSGCSRLTSIVIPEGVKSIGACTFAHCSALTEIMIPEGVTSIGDHAFSGCSGLTSIVIPECVASIGDGAFSGCSGLTSIVIPEGEVREEFLGRHPEHQAQVENGDALVTAAPVDIFRDLMGEARLSQVESLAARGLPLKLKFFDSDKCLLDASEAFTCLERAKYIEESEDDFIMSRMGVSYEASELALCKNAEDGGAKAKNLEDGCQRTFIRAYAAKNGVKEGESIVEGLSEHFQNQVCQVLSQCDMEDSVMELCARAAELGEERKLAYLCAGDVSLVYQGDAKTREAVEHHMVESIYSKLVRPKDVEAEDIFDNGEDELWKLLDKNLVDFLLNVKPDGQIVVCNLLDDIAKCQKDMGLPSQCILAPFHRDDMPVWVKEKVVILLGSDKSLSISLGNIGLFSTSGSGGAAKELPTVDNAPKRNIVNLVI
jgi:hypothetical protein